MRHSESFNVDLSSLFFLDHHLLDYPNISYTMKGSDILLIIVAVIFPPAAAAFIAGCSCDLLINVCLTILGYLPGHLHAFWLIYKKIRAEEKYGERGYRYVGNGGYEPVGQAPLTHNAPPGYGATN
ncbi:hypothetical protein DL96DRAFT_1571654 [Flagelloscypha sp. PMI_526]|nr:hypothetical protein DL96DRAFT_1571654 [Flagelloscypha sp. PMI_526]